MRITVDATAVPPRESAGIEYYVYGLARGLRSAGAGVHVAVRDAHADVYRERIGPDVPLRILPRGARNRVGADGPSEPPEASAQSVRAPSLRRVVSLARYGLANRGWQTDWSSDVTIYPFHRVPIATSRSVLVVHDLRSFTAGLGSPIDRWVIRRNVRKAGAVIVSWPHPYEHLLSEVPGIRDKTFVCPFPPPFLRQAAAGEEQPRKGGGGPLRLLYSSSTSPHKNHLLLLRAAQRLDVMHPRLDWHLDLAGPIVGDTGREVQRFVQAHLTGRVSLHGFVADDRLRELYTEADAVVVPTLWEAASSTILEGVSYGAAVLCSDIAPLRSQISWMQLEATLFDPESVEDLAEKMARLVRRASESAGENRPMPPSVAALNWDTTAARMMDVAAWVDGGGKPPLGDRWPVDSAPR